MLEFPGPDGLQAVVDRIEAQGCTGRMRTSA